MNGADNFHHAVCLHVAEAARADFLRDNAVAAWRALLRDGVIESRVVFEEFARVQEDALPAWRFLSLARLASGVGPVEFLRQAGAIAEPHAAVRRAEFLRPTPNSYHPGPNCPAAVYGIEYIRVFDGQLDAYRNMMSQQAGPAAGALVKAGFAHDFLTFDTERVLQTTDGIPDWTAIHILGLDDVARWDAFPQALDPRLRAIDPEAGFDAVFGPLPDIRAMERHVFARRVEELSVGF